MTNEINFITLKEVMAGLLDHPMLQDVTFEQCVRYALEFINKIGFPDIYQNKITDITIHEHRGMLPCDCVQVVQVMDNNGECLKHMTDNFYQYDRQIPSYKVQGRILFTTKSNCTVKVAYRSIPVDSDNFPMVPDIPLFLNALELYIKKKIFTIKFDMQEIPNGVLRQTQQDYAWAVAQLQSELNIPDVDEMANITYMLNQWIPSRHEFRKGFVNLGDHMHLPNERRR